MHFILISPTTWVATTPTRSLSDAVRIMEQEKLSYCIWLIPTDEPCAIDFYTPQAEGAQLVDAVLFKNGRRVKQKAQ